MKYPIPNMLAVALLSALAASFASAQPPRTAGPYSLAPEVSGTGSTGGQSTNGPYSLQSVTGASPATGGASGPYVANANFAGQLYNVVSLTLSAAADPVDEDSTVQLTADLTMDDGTMVNGGLVGWSVLSGPVTGIGPAGLASTGIVFDTTTATVQAELNGVMEMLAFDVADTATDNFGDYAGDGVEDSWQVNFFGAPPNADAAPAANPDGDVHDNYFEFLSGFDPTDKKDFLRFRVLPKIGSFIDIELTRMIPGTNYLLYSSTDLVFPAVPDDTFNVTTETIDGILRDKSASGPVKYYKIGLEKR